MSFGTVGGTITGMTQPTSLIEDIKQDVAADTDQYVATSTEIGPHAGSVENLTFTAGALSMTLATARMTFPLVTRPVYDDDGKLLPAIDVQMDIGSGPMPWVRMLLVLSPDQSEPLY